MIEKNQNLEEKIKELYLKLEYMGEIINNLKMEKENKEKENNDLKSELDKLNIISNDNNKISEEKLKDIKQKQKTY